MSAALRLLDTMAKDTPKRSRKPNAPAPSRIMPSSSFTFAATDDLFRDLLRYAAMQRKATGEPYSFQAACASLMLDRDKGVMKSKSSYERIWGWTNDQQRQRWTAIEKTIHDWKTMFGRLKTPPSEPQTDPEQIPNESQTDPEHLREISTESGGNPKQIPNTSQANPEHTNTALQLSGDKNNNSDAAREPEGAEEPEGEEYFDPHYRRPSREEVVGRGKLLGLDEGTCQRFLKKYTANGWINGSDQPIINWLAQLELWVDKEKAKALEPPPTPRGRGGMVAVRPPITHAAYCELSDFHRRDLAECYDDAGRIHWYRRGDGLPEPYTTTKPTMHGATAR